MSSSVVERFGVQTPQISHLPPDVHSLAAALEAIELAEAYGLALDESQRFTIEAAMGLRVDDTWAASEVADFEPRQNGKNDTIQAREMWGLFVGDERLQIHTAHEFPTANEAFLRMVATLEAFDDLRKEVARIRFANGEQGVELRNGARLKYRARTGGSARGFAEADLVVYDEAQHANPEHLAASAPATLANSNSQLWFAGSGGLSTSEIAWRLRTRALRGGAGRLAYIEHTAETVSVGIDAIQYGRPDDLLNPDLWALANPAYGSRISAEKLVSLFGVLGPDLFARECLCIWDPLPNSDGGGPISLVRWAELTDPQSSIVGEVSTAIDVSPDLKWSTVACAGTRPDGDLHGELGRRQPGTDWVIQFAKDNPQYGPYQIAGSSPAGFLLPLLDEAGVWTVDVPAGDVTQATSRLITAVDDGTIHHLGSNDIAAAISNATIVQRGDARVWSRIKSSGDISALVALTIAVGGVRADTDPLVRF